MLLSVLYLAIGDPIAATVGTLWGRRPLIGKKSLEGALANLFCSGLATFLVAMAYFHFALDRAIAIGVVGGLISATVELCPLPVDDNFTIPVLSAGFLSVVNLVFAFV